jgi:hypothetical protein
MAKERKVRTRYFIGKEETNIAKMGRLSLGKLVRGHRWLILRGYGFSYPFLRRITGCGSVGPFTWERINPIGRVELDGKYVGHIHDLSLLPAGDYTSRMATMPKGYAKILDFTLTHNPTRAKFARRKVLIHKYWDGDMDAYRRELQTTGQPSFNNPWYYGSPASPELARIRIRKKTRTIEAYGVDFGFSGNGESTTIIPLPSSSSPSPPS